MTINNQPKAAVHAARSLRRRPTCAPSAPRSCPAHAA